jgi:16S rRNA processing protein RimM
VPDSASAPAASEPRPGFVVVGRVLGAWGVRGALKVESLSDFPDRYARGASVWLGGEQRQIQQRHTSGRALVVKLSGVDDPETARNLRGALLEWPESELRTLADGEYYQHDLIDLNVETENGESLGTVAGLLPTGANDVLVVRGPRGEYLLPLIDDVVRRIDLQAGTVVVELLPGLEPTVKRTPRARQHPR